MVEGYWSVVTESSDPRGWKFLGGGVTPEPEWVDLGLPSGLKWAKYNLGATVPESAGLYFSWGNTDGHPAGAGYDFSQAVYDTTPAAEINTNLSLNEDAARAQLGAPWRMPTAAEFTELHDNCTFVWSTLNGVNGYLITSNVNGNSIFLPAAGFYGGATLYRRGTDGAYWSSTYLNMTTARYLSFSSTTVGPSATLDRRYGFSIRPVQDGTPNRSVIPPTTEDEPKEEETPSTEEPKDKDER